MRSIPLKILSFSPQQGDCRYPLVMNALLSVAYTNQTAYDWVFVKETPVDFFKSSEPYIYKEQSLSFVKSTLIQRGMFKQGMDIQTWKNNFSTEIGLNAIEFKI